MFLLPGLLLGFLIGYQYRGGEKPAPGTAEAVPLKKETASSPGPVSAAKPKTAVDTSGTQKVGAKTLDETLTSPVKSRRIAGLLSMVTSKPDSELGSLMKQFGSELNAGRLSGPEFQLAVELLGERGSPAAAAALLENKTALKKFPDAFTGFFAGWAQKNSRNAWAFCASQFAGDGSSCPEAVLKGIARGCAPDAPELQAVIDAAKLQPDRVAMWRVEPVVRTSGFSGASQAVRRRITGEPSEQTAFNEMAAIGDLALDAGRDAISQAARDISAGGRLGPNTFPDPSGHLIKEYATRSPAEALEWAKTLPSGSQRAVAMGAVLFHQGLKDPDKALEWAKTLPKGSYEERVNVLMGLENAFRQSPKLNEDERKDLVRQTQALKEELNKEKK